MMSSSSNANDGEDEFPPNPFQSVNHNNINAAAPPQQQQQQQQMNQFYGEAPQAQPTATTTTSSSGGQWMQPQPDNFTIDDDTTNNVGIVASGPMVGTMTPQQQQEQQPPVVPPSSSSWWQRVTRCGSLDTYKVYFDVDTVDVVSRLKHAVVTCHVPDRFRTEIVGVQRTDAFKGPDLYGPFWMTMTLVFFLAVTSNLHAYLHSTTQDNFEYDITHLVRAMTVLFSFAFGLPSLLWLTTQCMGMNSTVGLGVMDWICLYGYSLVLYLPTTMLCLIPYEPIEWLVLALATAGSCLLILRNIAAPLLSADVSQQKAAPIMLFVLASHVVFLLVLKFVFYHHPTKTTE